jgi:hypothetical protein
LIVINFPLPSQDQEDLQAMPHTVRYGITSNRRNEIKGKVAQTKAIYSFV